MSVQLYAIRRARAALARASLALGRRRARAEARARVAALLLAVGTLACQESSARADATSNTAPKPQVIFHLSQGDVPVSVELAITEAEQARGLMYRKELPKGHGMLFLFAQEAIHAFWMKNTYLPLDMIHFNSQGLVVGVVKDALPLTLTSRKINTPSKYVLEVNAGFATELGIVPGTRATMVGLPAELAPKPGG